jgi:hypothetical protein
MCFMPIRCEAPGYLNREVRTPEEKAADLRACREAANGAALFVAKALGDSARAQPDGGHYASSGYHSARKQRASWLRIASEEKLAS